MTDSLLAEILELTDLTLHVRSFYISSPFHEQLYNCINLSKIDTITVNTCAQLTAQKHENQIICGKRNSVILFI
jgi:hypothetical protein